MPIRPTLWKGSGDDLPKTHRYGASWSRELGIQQGPGRPINPTITRGCALKENREVCVSGIRYNYLLDLKITGPRMKYVRTLETPV